MLPHRRVKVNTIPYVDMEKTKPFHINTWNGFNPSGDRPRNYPGGERDARDGEGRTSASPNGHGPVRRPVSTQGRNRTRGVQIDLLIQTDRTAWIVEAKRRTRIGRKIGKELSDKVAAFPKRRGISVRTALVYSGVLDEAVTRSGSFDAIVPFSRILGLSGQ